MSDFRPSIAGYPEIQKEIEVCRKYGIDYRAQKGRRAEVVNRLHPRRLQLKVAEIIKETPSAATLRLVAREGKVPPFQAGQYISLQVGINGVRTSRPYSISSSPQQTAYYDVTVRRIPHGFVSDYLLDQVKVGDVLESSGPAGHFYYNPVFHGNHLLFLAGGSGVTPFMSMIRENIELGLEKQIDLFYGSKTADELIFHAELQKMAAKHAGFNYYPVVENRPADDNGLCGLISTDLIKSVLGDVELDTIYICGPEAMYANLIPQLGSLGVPQRRIRREVFAAAADISREPGWPQDISPQKTFSVQVAGHKAISARAGEPLLTALERAGILVPSLCRSGECSLCRVQLLSGTVFQAPGVLLRESDKQYGYVHSCKAYPITDLEIRLS